MAQGSDKSMTKSQLVAHIAEETALQKKQVEKVLEVLTDVAYKEAKKDKGFTLPGFGKLVLVTRKARTARNPSTGETIQVPEKKAVKFKIAKQAKEAILG